MDLRDPGVTAAQVIAALALQPHPEGGHYREIWRDAPEGGGRGAGTAIYFLLAADEFSHWHRVDAAEAWHWYAGGPLALSLSPDGHDAE
ncbi:MAG: cupin domain-containing protein, partial [Alphaproteobacteria bacterium]